MVTTVVNVCSTPVSFYTIERYGECPKSNTHQNATEAFIT